MQIEQPAPSQLHDSSSIRGLSVGRVAATDTGTKPSAMALSTAINDAPVLFLSTIFLPRLGHRTSEAYHFESLSIEMASDGASLSALLPIRQRRRASLSMLSVIFSIVAMAHHGTLNRVGQNVSTYFAPLPAPLPNAK